MSKQTELERMFSMLQNSDGSNAAHHRFCNEYITSLGFNPDAPCGSIKAISDILTRQHEMLQALQNDPAQFMKMMDEAGEPSPEAMAIVDKLYDLAMKEDHD